MSDNVDDRVRQEYVYGKNMIGKKNYSMLIGCMITIQRNRSVRNAFITMNAFYILSGQLNKPDQATMRPDCVSACIDFGARLGRTNR